MSINLSARQKQDFMSYLKLWPNRRRVRARASVWGFRSHHIPNYHFPLAQTKGVF